MEYLISLNKVDDCINCNLNVEIAWHDSAIKTVQICAAKRRPTDLFLGVYKKGKPNWCPLKEIK